MEFEKRGNSVVIYFFKNDFYISLNTDFKILVLLAEIPIPRIGSLPGKATITMDELYFNRLRYSKN